MPSEAIEHIQVISELLRGMAGTITIRVRFDDDGALTLIEDPDDVAARPCREADDAIDGSEE
jgi:hypothetical protein